MTVVVDDSPIGIGKRLQLLRVYAGLTQKDLATLANVNVTSISYWEHANSQMKLNSMEKIISALQGIGIECSTEWLATGLGNPPTQLNQKNSNASRILDTPDYNFINAEVQNFIHSHLDKSCEVLEITDNLMAPALFAGDIIGGIWRSSEIISLERICIIEINNQLEARKIKKTDIPGYFDVLHLTFDQSSDKPFKIKNLPLTRVAPIVRLWRKL